MKFIQGLLNERGLAVLLVVLAVLLALFIPGAWQPAVEIMALKFMYVALLLSVVFALIYVLRGTAYDFYTEILKEHNIAGAIFVAALIVGVAVVIGQ